MSLPLKNANEQMQRYEVGVALWIISVKTHLVQPK